MNSIRNPNEMEAFLRSINISKNTKPVTKSSYPSFTYENSFTLTENAKVGGMLLGIFILGLAILFGTAALM